MSTEPSKLLVVNPGGGRAYDGGRIQAIFKADGDETGSRFSVSEWWLEPRTRGPGPHAHPEDHLFHVLEGTVSLFVDGAWHEAAKGTYVLIPGGTPHDFENRTTERAGFMSLNVPGGFESRLPDIAAALASTDLTM
jgi:quercetin dioxygenase-like cupin family protein